MPIPIIIICFYNPYAAIFALYLFCLTCGFLLLGTQSENELLVNPQQTHYRLKMMLRGKRK